MGNSTTYLTYTYDATGTVLRKQHYSSGTLALQFDYIDGFMYTTQSGTTSLTYITNVEGRIVNNSGTLAQEYIMTDQQGNARFSFQDSGGAIAAKQENSYYPFGETYKSSTLSAPTVPNKNLYNGGSEWQNDFTNLPDYQQAFLRNYDAEIGRFIAVDPQPEGAEDMNVYQYAGNNPVMMNDPTGGKATAGGTSGNEYGTNRAVSGFQPHLSTFEVNDILAAYEGDYSDYDLAGMYYGFSGGGQTNYGTGNITADVSYLGNSFGEQNAGGEGISMLSGSLYKGGVNTYTTYMDEDANVSVHKNAAGDPSEFLFGNSAVPVDGTAGVDRNFYNLNQISATAAFNILQNANQAGQSITGMFQNVIKNAKIGVPLTGDDLENKYGVSSSGAGFIKSVTKTSARSLRINWNLSWSNKMKLSLGDVVLQDGVENFTSYGHFWFMSGNALGIKYNGSVYYNNIALFSTYLSIPDITTKYQFNLP